MEPVIIKYVREKVMVYEVATDFVMALFTPKSWEKAQLEKEIKSRLYWEGLPGELFDSGKIKFEE